MEKRIADIYLTIRNNATCLNADCAEAAAAAMDLLNRAEGGHSPRSISRALRKVRRMCRETERRYARLVSLCDEIGETFDPSDTEPEFVFASDSDMWPGSPYVPHIHSRRAMRGPLLWEDDFNVEFRDLVSTVSICAGVPKMQRTLNFAEYKATDTKTGATTSHVYWIAPYEPGEDDSIGDAPVTDLPAIPNSNSAFRHQARSWGRPLVFAADGCSSPATECNPVTFSPAQLRGRSYWGDFSTECHNAVSTVSTEAGVPNGWAFWYHRENQAIRPFNFLYYRSIETGEMKTLWVAPYDPSEDEQARASVAERSRDRASRRPAPLRP